MIRCTATMWLCLVLLYTQLSVSMYEVYSQVSARHQHAKI